MGSSKKMKMCKYSKNDINDSFEDLKKKVSSPRYICRKCIRVAESKDCLCKPEKLANKD